MQIANSIMKNTAFLLIGNFALKIVTAFTAILLTRYLSPEKFGQLSVALALAAIANFMAKMSLSHTVIREGTKANADIKSLFGGALKLRIVFSMLATLVFVPLIQFFYSDLELRRIALIIVIPTIWGGSFLSLGDVYFQVTQRMEFTALFRALPSLLTAVLIILGICLSWPLIGLASAYGISALMSGLFGVFIVRRLVPGMGGWHSGLLDGLWAFALGGVMTLLLGQMGPLILERITNIAEVGYFAVAFRIPLLLYTFPGALAVAFYPRLFHLGNKSPTEHFELTVKETRFMNMLGLGLALPFMIYPEWTVELLFGSQWVVTTPKALSYLAWMVVLQCLNYPLADALATSGLQSRRSAVLVGALFVGITLFWILGKNWGAIGGAVAALIVEVFIMIGLVAMNPARWALIRQCLCPQALVVFSAYTVGKCMKSIFNYEFFGCFIMLILYFMFIYVYENEFRKVVKNYMSKALLVLGYGNGCA